MTDAQSAAALFEDDLIKMVMQRLQVKLQVVPHWTGGTDQRLEVMLIDYKTQHAVLCPSTLVIKQPGISFSTE